MLLVGAAACLAGMVGTPLAAQNQVQAQRLLVLTPLPVAPSDSAYAVESGTAFRG